MSDSRPVRRAVVVGGGLAGILACSALLTSCEDVVLVERDEALGTGEPRRGMPHGDHLHNLLGRAHQEIDRLVPGALAALRDDGCGVVSVADETHVYELGHVMPKRPVGLTIHSAERRHIDEAVYAAISGDDRLEVRAGTTMVGVELHAGAVQAVHLADRTGVCQLEADLLVVATGAASSERITELLHAREVPKEVRASGRWYATATASFEAQPQAWMCFPSGNETRGALLSPARADRWMLSVNGLEDTAPPRRREDMRSFVRSLPDPAIAEQVEAAAVESDPVVFRRSRAVWRRFEHSELPDGVTFVGDAVAALDPLLGQGASVAAWQAARLWELAQDGLPAHELAVRHRRAASRCVEAVWDLGGRVAAAIAEEVGGADPYTPFVARLHDDPALHVRYVRIWHLLDDVPSFTEMLR